MTRKVYVTTGDTFQLLLPSCSTGWVLVGELFKPDTKINSMILIINKLCMGSSVE